MSSACVYAPGPWGDCLDLTCRQQGGRCQFVGGTSGRTACRCVPASPSPSRVSLEVHPVEDALEMYRRHVAEQPPCEATLFRDALAQYRAGDERGARIISGSCLSLALQIAEQRANEFAELPVLDVIEEANAGLWEAVTTFSGNDRDEFLRYMKEKINQRLAILV